MIRSCIVCRKKRSSLLSLFLDGENRVTLGKSVRRQYWICPSKGCLKAMEKPNKRAKAFRRKNINSNSLLLQVHNRINRNIEKQLMLSLRSGVVCSGSYEILRNQNKLLLLITSSCQIKNRWRDQKIDVPIFSMNTSPFELGAMIRKGPRSAIGIFPNCHSILLSENLHLLEELR